MRSLVANQQASELQGFVNDLKEALEMFKVNRFPSEHTPFISKTDISLQASADIPQILQSVSI